MLEPEIGQKVIIAGDNEDPEILGRYLDGIDLLVHECTYLQETFDNLKVKVQHTTAKDLGICAQKHAVRNLIATHINPRYHPNGKIGIDAVSDEIKHYYQGKVFIANDFDTYRVENSTVFALEK